MSSYRWAFNTSRQFVDIPENDFTRKPYRSVLTYTPQTQDDFGTLLCWGRNELGFQTEPCVFQLTPAGKIVDLEVLITCRRFGPHVFDNGVYDLLDLCPWSVCKVFAQR